MHPALEVQVGRLVIGGKMMGKIFFVRIYVSLASGTALGLTLFVCLTYCSYCFSKLRALLSSEVISQILPSGGKIGFGVQRRRCFRPVTFTEKMSSFKVRRDILLIIPSF